MTALLPKLPRRKWDPSDWNIVRVGSALGATLALGACQDETTSSEVAETGYDEWVDSYDEWTDYTDYTDYSDYSDYTDYSEWTDYSDYADYSDYNDWSDDWYYECYVDEDCGPGMQCLDGYCIPLNECATSSECAFDEFCDQNGACEAVDVPAQCLAPALAEIPLPAEAGGVIVAMRFIDVDDDPAEELVLLRSDAIVIIDGDQAVTVPHTGYALDGIAATDADESAGVDLIATSSTKLNSRVFLADGMGGFIDSGTGPGMMLDHAHGIDWPLGGPGELVARSQADEGIKLSNVAELMPVIEVLHPGPIDSIVVGDFDGNADLDYALLSSCTPMVVPQQGAPLGSGAVGPPGACSMTAGNFDDDGIADLVTLRSDDSFSVVTVHAPFGEPFLTVGLNGVYQDAQASRFAVQFGATTNSVLAQTSGTLEYLFTEPMDGSWCRGTLDELPPLKRFATGDFDGDGDVELAVIALDGAVSLWSEQ